MRLFNMKFRRFFDRIKWPLVTRARYQQNKDNYEAELRATEQLAAQYLTKLNSSEFGELQQQLGAARTKVKQLETTVVELNNELLIAKRNDNRNPETGKYEKAGE